MDRKISTDAGYFAQSIIGKEMLCQISSRKVLISPVHRSIGALTFIDGKGRHGKGSAILISSNLILTAAHNIYSLDPELIQPHTSFRFYLAPHGQVDNFYEIEEWAFPQNYTTCPPAQKLYYDYAIMKLKKNIKLPIQIKNFCELYVACAKCKEQDHQDMELGIYGYPYLPYQLPNYNCDHKGKILELYQYGLTRQGRIESLNPSSGKITHRISTLSGQSGCPIISQGNIIAIHIGSDGKECNVGRLITFDVVENIQKWRRKLRGDRFIVNFKSICSHYKPSQEKMGMEVQTMPLNVIHLPIQSQKQFIPKFHRQKILNAHAPQVSSVKTIPKMLYQLPNKHQQQLPIVSKHQISLQEQKRLLQEAKSLFNKGYAIFASNYQLARNYFLQSIDNQEKALGKDALSTAEARRLIGTSYYSEKVFLKAIYFLSHHVKIFEKHASLGQEYAYALWWLGLAYYESKDFKNAIQTFQKLRSTGKRIQSKDWVRRSVEYLDKCTKDAHDVKGVKN